MSIVYLNGQYMPIEQAKISPMDRGFLFGDGIYEVVPSLEGRFIGLGPHIDRFLKGLAAIEIHHSFSRELFKDICVSLSEKNGGGNLGIYLHVSRGADTKRYHAFPEDIQPTLFAYTFTISDSAIDAPVKTYKVATQTDLRWQHCDIKSTALLGNVLHFQQSHAAGYDETLLFNAKDELTEAAACNVFVVRDGVVSTPLLDSQKLPGITRLLLLKILTEHSDQEVHERVITKQEVMSADEIWLTSSTRQVAPVVSVDERVLGSGEPGPIWKQAHALFCRHQFDYND